MVLDDVKNLPVMQTRAISTAQAQDEGQTHNYIVDCVHRLYAGDYGKICEDDTAANNAELDAGEGRIVARYEQRHDMTGDIYIIATFSKSMPDSIDANHIMIMYCNEY